MKMKSFLFVVFVVLLMMVAAASGTLSDGAAGNAEEGNEVKDVKKIRLVHDYLIPPPPSQVIYDNIKKIMDNEEKKEV